MFSLLQPKNQYGVRAIAADDSYELNFLRKTSILLRTIIIYFYLSI